MSTSDPTAAATSQEQPEEVLRIGQYVGSFRVVRKLGDGGMGTVFAAEHRQIGYRAAIKVLHHEYSQQAEIARRFLNEARAVNMVQHPGIVKIFEFGRLLDRTAYIIMEYLEGQALNQRLLQAGGPLPPAEALRLTRQVASAITAAHERGIIHRDLKPANVILVPDPEAPGRVRAKVLDFGLAKVPDASASDLGYHATSTGVVLGTAMYMSPEQCRGSRDVDGKADVYSLGVMLYELLTGLPPFRSHSPGELVSMHLRDPPPPLREVAPLVPGELADLVHELLAKSPAERPTMAEVVGRLELLGTQTGLAPPTGAAPLPPLLLRARVATPLPPASPSSMKRVQPRSRRGKVAALVVALVLTGAAALLSRALLQGPRGPEAGRVVFQSVPSGTRYYLRSAWNMGPQGVWVVGDTGSIVHYDGKAFREVPSGTTQSLRAVWGMRKDDVWAVGSNGTIVHWNGLAWGTEPTEGDNAIRAGLRGLWGAAPGDVWAAGEQGTILHYDGKTWSPVPSGTKDHLRSIWGSGPRDIWVVGEYGVILHWDGTAWSRAESGSTSWLARVGGSGPKDVWVVGNEGTILHYDGKGWSPVSSGVQKELSGVWASGPRDVWVVGNDGTVLHHDGRSWARLGSGTKTWLYGVWGNGPEDVWAAGANGLILHYQPGPPGQPGRPKDR